MIYHAAILLKIVNYWPFGGQFKKRNREITFFLFRLGISNTTFGTTVHCTSIKKYEGKHHFISKFNFELFKTLIWSFAYIHSKRRKLGIFILFRPFAIAWISSDCFESFSPLSNVWIDRPLIPSCDVTTTRKPGSDFDWLIV